jgi:6,7-dimethyl-8-ribityllumazine synthase
MYRSPKTPVDFNQHYFSRLTSEQKEVYKAIATGIMAFAKKIKIPLRPINELSMIFSSILLDNPVLFYVSSFSCQNDLYKKRCIIVPDYKYEQSCVKVKARVIESNLRKFDVVRGKSDYDKVLFVHDHCLANFSYDYTPDDSSHTILGIVNKNKAVCEGVAKFVKLALDYLGVKTIVVPGKARNPFDGAANEEHAWNIVALEGNVYHLDVTFDMTITGKTKRYDYFCLSDEDIKKDHTILENVPSCKTTGKDYYSKNNMLAKRPAEIEELIASELRKGTKCIVVKIIGAQFSDKVIDKLMRVAEHQYRNIHNGNGQIEINCNASQMVFEISFK